MSAAKLRDLCLNQLLASTSGRSSSNLRSLLRSTTAPSSLLPTSTNAFTRSIPAVTAPAVAGLHTTTQRLNALPADGASAPSSSQTQQMQASTETATRNQPRRRFNLTLRFTVPSLREALHSNRAKEAFEIYKGLDYAARDEALLMGGPNFNINTLAPNSPLRELSIQDFNSLLAAMRRSEVLSIMSLEQCKRWVDQILLRMSQCNVRPSTGTYVNAANIFAREGDVEKVEFYLDAIRQNSLPQSRLAKSLLCQAYANAGNGQMAEQLLTQVVAESMGIPELPMGAFNSVLEMFSKKKDQEGMLRWWNKLDALGLRADTASYDHMINFWANIGDMQKAHALIKEKQRLGLPNTSRSYNSLIRGYVSLSQHDQVLDVFQEMAEHGVPVNTATYNLVLKSYVDQRDPDAAMRVYMAMISSKVKSSLSTLALLTQTLVPVEHHTRLNDIIVGAGGVPSKALYRSVLQGYAHNIDRLIDAEKRKIQRQRREQKEANKEPVKAADTHLAIEMPAELAAEVAPFVEAARSLWKQYIIEASRNSRWAVSSDIYKSYIRLLLDSHQTDEALSVFKEARQRGMELDTYIYNGLLAHYAMRKRSKESFDYVYQMMLQDKIPLDAFTFNLRLINEWGMSQFPEGEEFGEEAMKVLREFGERADLMEKLQLGRDRTLLFALNQAGEGNYMKGIRVLKNNPGIVLKWPKRQQPEQQQSEQQ
ncbi:hypothetical protein HK102_007319 [Quaeritorhiza haematococci]|nr:hypothetical protein HK102_007319 [Quaeritorhiza haematococci]